MTQHASAHVLAILSDIHYASAAEQVRGDDYERRGLNESWSRIFLKAYRHFVWLRYPLRQNHLLDQFLGRIGEPDVVVANGDYSCDSGFVGVSDDASFQSAAECLTRLRERFGARFCATLGDHELGKLTLVGCRGGMRVASYFRARDDLGIKSFWRMDLGRYALFGVASSLIAFPVFRSDALEDEWPEWNRLREEHLAEVRAAFSTIGPARRILLFCHDPTALPFLWREDAVRNKLPQVEQTIIGHLHSPLIFWKSRVLAGMPAIRRLGHSVKRMSTALNEAKYWKPFHVRLCPSLAGVELLKDGGFLTAELDPDGKWPARFRRHHIRR